MEFIGAGLLLFFGPHFISFTRLRPVLAARLGEARFKAAYSLFSLAGLGLLAMGYWQARSGPLAADYLWYPPEIAPSLASWLNLAAMILIPAALLKGHFRLWLRHPMSLGMALWASAHLLASGKTATAFIFGAFLLLALVDIAVGIFRGVKPGYAPRWSQDVLALLAGLALFGFFALVFHPYVLNLPVLN